MFAGAEVRLPIAMADSEVLAWASAPAATQVAMPDGALILDFFERTASEHPASTALVWLESLSGPETSVSYAALDADANKLANHLINVLGLRTGDIVLQFCDKGVPMVVAILATVSDLASVGRLLVDVRNQLKAGATYVPLDPEHPAGRTRAIQAASSATLCLTTSDLRSNLVARLPDAVLLDVDVFVRNAPAIDYKPVPLPARPGHDDLCYIMFTSGSTGVPKGVCIPHRAVVSSIINGPPHNQLLRGKGQALRVLQFSNYAFDVVSRLARPYSALLTNKYSPYGTCGCRLPLEVHFASRPSL
jgi:non-ribosomal peptide synthetase component F